jgi:hypothetical protein
VRFKGTITTRSHSKFITSNPAILPFPLTATPLAALRWNNSRPSPLKPFQSLMILSSNIIRDPGEMTRFPSVICLLRPFRNSLSSHTIRFSQSGRAFEARYERGIVIQGSFYHTVEFSAGLDKVWLTFCFLLFRNNTPVNP